MTSKSEKAVYNSVMHKMKWGAPLGMRKCKYHLSDDCAGIDDESTFNGHKCWPCSKQTQRERYHKRMAAAIKARGYPKQKPGPKKKTEDSDSE